MLERVCRTCQAGNNLDATTCTTCRSPLENQPLEQRSNTTSLRTRIERIPLLQSRRARSVALGLGAIALELGTALIRQHAAQKSESTQPHPLAPITHSKRHMVRQRVWEQFDSAGQLRSRVVENLIVRDE